ncbi:MAG: hypothetical protein KGJ01_00690 [Patescibacteria group bacterium]|nr:hypothetical protein [Patescibacteria group bacterium]
MDQGIKQNVIKGLGLDALPEEAQERAVESISKIIFQNIIVNSLDSLSEADQDAFEKLLSSEGVTGDAISEFLSQKIPNFDELVEKEVASFRNEAAEFVDNTEGGEKVS